MSEEKVMLSARIPEELKELVGADRRTNEEVVRAALWREFGGERKASIDRRIEEKERRISMVESERNERERELEEVRKELEALKTKREKMESNERDAHRQALEKLSNVPADPSNGFIIDTAEELDMTPEELAREVAEYHGKEFKDDDGNNFRSL